jgi:molybdopterin-guanine dinucleotide biosynthesis protein A
MKLNSAMILAGGKGSRIGYDKKNLIMGGEKIIDKLITAMSNHFDEIIVSSNTTFKRENIITVKDSIGEGPLAGIYSALKICKSEYLYVIACDMPFISISHIDSLKKIICDGNDYDAVVCKRDDGFMEPFNSFYNKSCLPSIQRHLEDGEYKMGYLLKKLNVYAITQFDEKLFFNINYAEDLAAAEKS